jgi:hypothetical protein
VRETNEAGVAGYFGFQPHVENVFVLVLVFVKGRNQRRPKDCASLVSI